MTEIEHLDEMRQHIINELNELRKEMSEMPTDRLIKMMPVLSKYKHNLIEELNWIDKAKIYMPK